MSSRYSFPLEELSESELAAARTRFWRNVNKDSSSSCWLWTGRATGKELKYGTLVVRYINRRKYYHTVAHRFSYFIHCGNPGKFLVCHKCDVPTCVNPDHLFAGTDKDNMLDMKVKGRTAYYKISGVNNKRSKLSELQVIEVRESLGKPSIRSLAKKYNVTRGVIKNIVIGKSYKAVGQSGSIEKTKVL